MLKPFSTNPFLSQLNMPTINKPSTIIKWFKTTSQSILTQSNLTEHFLRESNQLLHIHPNLSHLDRMFEIKLIRLCKRDPPQGSLWVRRRAWICLGLQLNKEYRDLSASKLVCNGLQISVIENKSATEYGWQITRATYWDANQKLFCLHYT